MLSSVVRMFSIVIRSNIAITPSIELLLPRLVTPNPDVDGSSENIFLITKYFEFKLQLGQTEDGRRRRDERTDRGRTTATERTMTTGRTTGRTDGQKTTTGHDGTDGQRTEYDDGARRTTGQTDAQRTTTATTGRTPKSQIRRWDQYSNVKANRPYNHLSRHAPTFPAC